MSQNENGRSWALAFWIVSSICGVWLLALTNGVVANDRLRENGDHMLVDKLDSVRYGILDKLTHIDKRLSRIEERLDIRDETK